MNSYFDRQRYMNISYCLEISNRSNNFICAHIMAKSYINIIKYNILSGSYIYSFCLKVLSYFLGRSAFSDYSYVTSRMTTDAASQRFFRRPRTNETIEYCHMIHGNQWKMEYVLLDRRFLTGVEKVSSTAAILSVWGRVEFRMNSFECSVVCKLKKSFFC